MDAVSYTAQWMAAARAQESERDDALFIDPLARELAAPRGFELIERYAGGGLLPVHLHPDQVPGRRHPRRPRRERYQAGGAHRRRNGHPGLPARLAGRRRGVRGRPRPADRGEAAPARGPRRRAAHRPS